MIRTLHASFIDPDNASRAVGALLDHGVRAEDISVYVKSAPIGWREKHPDGVDVMDTAKDGLTTTTAEDAAAGGMKGAGVGLGLGVLAGLAAITVPGVGLVFGGGALATAIAGAAATTAAGAVAGSVYGWLSDQGVNEEAVTRLSSTVEEGGALVSVTAPSANLTDETIEAILAKYGANDLVMAKHPITEPVWNQP